MRTVLFQIEKIFNTGNTYNYLSFAVVLRRTDVWEKFFRYNLNTQYIFAFTRETEKEQSTVHSRMFAPAMGISEDPATRVASGPLGAYLVEHGVMPQTENGAYYIRSEQGIELGRPSIIDILIRKEEGKYKEVKISGNCVIIGSRPTLFK
jgi:trans-2,3-dihydro-3-hydroxyanthranilate isomerase